MTRHQPVPCPPPWYRPAAECFDMVKQLEEMLQTLVDQSVDQRIQQLQTMIDQSVDARIQQLVTLIDQTVDQRIQQLLQQGTLLAGVVDGSDAAPGQIGELISGSAQLNFTATGTTSSTVTPTLVVAPGDWDLWAWMTSSAWTQTMHFNLLVVSVPGISNSMASQSLAPATASATEGIAVLTGVQARGSFSVPTSLPFAVDVVGNGTAGYVTLNVQGRRRR